MRNNRIRIGLLVCALCMMATLSGCRAEKRAQSEAYRQGIKAVEKNDLELALSYFEKAESENKAEAYRGEGIVYLKKEAYSSAITMFEHSVNAWKRSKSADKAFYEDVRYYQAEALVKNGQEETALEVYADLTNGSRADLAFLMRGILYTNKHEISQAKENFDKAVQKNPSFENCLRIYEALAAIGRKADGGEYLQKALQDTSDQAEANRKRGQIYYYLGNFEEAKKSFRKAYEQGDGDAISMLAKVSMESKDIQAARDVYEEAVRSGKNTGEAYNGLALCDIAEGKYDEALKHIEEGLEKSEVDAPVREALLYNEAVVYEKKLDFVNAQAKFKVFLESYPDHEAARKEAVFLASRVHAQG